MSSREEALRVDAESRYRAQVIFDTPLVLEAGAGTGKTSTLVARVVCWCLGEGWERGEEREREIVHRREQSPESVRDRVAADVLSRVSAITFTEAAAAEMAERAGEAFSGLASGELRPGLMEEALPADLEERRLRARALLGGLDHLVVRTIHAWCRRLLARHPLESGMHPGFQVDADGRLQAAVVREVVEEATRDAYASTEGSVLLDLAVQGYGPRELEATLLVLLEKGVTPSALAADPFAPERIRMALAELEAAFGPRRGEWCLLDGCGDPLKTDSGDTGGLTVHAYGSGGDRDRSRRGLRSIRRVGVFDRDDGRTLERQNLRALKAVGETRLQHGRDQSFAGRGTRGRGEYRGVLPLGGCPGDC